MQKLQLVRVKDVTASEREKAMQESVKPKLGIGSVGGFEQLWAGNPIAALEELFELLEEYSPSWYTEEHHKHAVAALIGEDTWIDQHGI